MRLKLALQLIDRSLDQNIFLLSFTTISPKPEGKQQTIKQQQQKRLVSYLSTSDEKNFPTVPENTEFLKGC